MGSTTLRTDAIVTAASKAFPPALRVSIPASVAKGWAELTIPFLATAGEVSVPSRTFSLGLFSAEHKHIKKTTAQAIDIFRIKVTSSNQI
jgi:hypothetical protein